MSSYFGMSMIPPVAVCLHTLTCQVLQCKHIGHPLAPYKLEQPLTENSMFLIPCLTVTISEWRLPGRVHFKVSFAPNVHFSRCRASVNVVTLTQLHMRANFGHKNNLKKSLLKCNFIYGRLR